MIYRRKRKRASELPYSSVLLAEAYKKAGHVEDGLATLTEALAVIGESGERYYEAEVYRLKGELTFQSSTQDCESKIVEAEECFQKAFDVAHGQEAKSLELRAATSLAYLWQSQGKIIEARAVLASVYHWFTEGFDTADLKDAKKLLDSLSEDR